IPFLAQAASSSAEANLANNLARSDKTVHYVVLTLFANADAKYSIDSSPVLRGGAGLERLYFPPNSTVTIGFPSPQIVQAGTVIFRRWLDGSTDNPRTFALGSTDQTANAVFDRIDVPIVRSDSIVNAASFRSGAVSAGEIVTLFGFNLGPSGLVKGQF